jgi:carbon-monoxide dehydrogenase medium subunit
MISQSFDYVQAKSVDDAISLLTRHGDDAKLLAGGHSLIPSMKLRLNSPATVIDISGISGLTEIKKNGASLDIGALVTHRSVEFSDVVKSGCAVLADAAAKIGDSAVRNHGTLGGNLAHADPAADYPALVLALGAEIHVTGKSGERVIAADNFFTGLFETSLGADEIITNVKFPVIGKATGAAYEKFKHPASRFAVVGVAATVTVDGSGSCTAAKIGITGAAEYAFRAAGVENALVGKKLDESFISEATEKVVDAADLMGEVFASQEYRAQLCSVLAKRALMAAVAGAGG